MHVCICSLQDRLLVCKHCLQLAALVRVYFLLTVVELRCLFYAVYLMGSLVLLQSFGLGWPLWFAMEIAAFQALWHFGLIYKREREGCFKAFRMNHWLGATVFAGVVGGFQLRAQLLP